MRCPYCDHPNTRVLDSRPTAEGKEIRRRRECELCGKRFNSYERVEQMPVVVVKKDGSREEFDKKKLVRGLMRAGEKRDVPIERWEALVNEIERELLNDVRSEFPTREVGDRILEKIKHVDEVAYIRFASVYNRFDSAQAFLDELARMIKK